MHSGWALPWIGGGLGIVALAAAWLAFGPIGLGGSTGYVFVVGSSMEPHLGRGDLVLVRRSADYRVGDVVAYHSRILGKVVLHRIVAVRDGELVLKGDANDFVDPGAVSRSDVVGRYWARIPGAAPVLLWVRTPWHAALVTGLAGLLAFGTGGGVALGRRRRRRRRAESPAPVAPAAPGRIAWQPVAAASGLLLLACASLAVVAVAVPAVRAVPTSRLYSESGSFSYGARAPAGPAYSDGRVSSGEAVFSSLVHRLGLGFEWRLRSSLPHRVGGTASLVAVVSDGQGWSRRFVLAPARRFAGDRVSLRGVLDLQGLEALLRRLEQGTGTRPGTYQLALEPRIALGGTVAGQPVRDVFAPSLAFVLDEIRLAPAPPATDAPNGLTRQKDVAGALRRPNALSFLGARLSPRTAERLALAEGLLALIGLLLALRIRSRAEGADDESRAKARHGGSIVEVAGEPASARVIDVAGVEELVRVAERYERLILHHGASHTFLVEDDGVAFRWRAPEAVPESAAAERRDLSRRPWARPRRAEPAVGELSV